MASLFLGGIGAAIGSAIPGSFLGMSFTSIGWSIGSFIGNALTAPKGQNIEGPRLNDKSVSTSAYGNMRPVIYGTYRAGVDIIWSTDLQEHRHKHSSGGKGGGGGGSYTEYTYTVSFAAAICKGPIVGVRKIYMDSKLVWSQADDVGADELQHSDKIGKKIKVYLGTTTQDPDPTIEAYKGAGNVPAYRGTAYIVFTDLDVTGYGNRIPVITVEVVESGSSALTKTTLNALGAYHGTLVHVNNGVVMTTTDNVDSSSGTRPFVSYKINLSSGNIVSQRRFNVVMSGYDATRRFAHSVGLNQSEQYYFTIQDITSPVGLNLGVSVRPETGSSQFNFTSVLRCRVSLDNATNLVYYPAYDCVVTDDYKSIYIGCTLYFYHFADGTLYRFDIPNVENPLAIFPAVISPTFAVSVDSTRYQQDGSGSNEYPHMCRDRDSGDLYCGLWTNSGTPQFSVKRFDVDGNFIEEKLIGVTGISGNQGIAFAFDNGILWMHQSTSLKGYDWQTESLLYSTSGFTEGSYIDVNDIIHMTAAGNVLVANYDGTVSAAHISVARNTVPLSTVVSDICQSAGISPSDIDVSQLTDEVRGFMVSQQDPARGALQQLAGAYFFDDVESDGVLKFVKRGGSVAATIQDEDIGCYGDGENVAELLESARVQEEELPKSMTLLYANHDADYQQGAQHCMRQSVLNGTDITVQAPLSLTDSEAKKVVDTLDFSTWHNRQQFKFSTWQKWSKLEPTDVVSVRGQSMRITKRSEGVNGLLMFEAVRELPEIYTGQVGTAAPSGHPNQHVTVPGPTHLFVMDLPPLRDQDYNRDGIYIGMTGLLSGWPGATVLASSDNGSTWTAIDTNNVSTVSGYCETTLGNFSSGNIFDETNILRVTVVGTLQSVTTDQVLNGDNVALVGSEIIQFRTATLVSTGVYDLSGLLRGRLGTDAYISTHGTYEDFVLLDASALHFVELQSTEYNTARLYGALAFGDSIGDAIDTQSITYLRTNETPFSPVQIGGGKTSFSSDWTISWTRRSRYQWQWLDTVDVGSDEVSNDFEVDILNGSNVVRTITVTGATTCTYTAAQQVADFGGAQATITVNVRQKGALKNSANTQATITSSLTTTSVALLHFDGSNGSTTITDVYGHTFTPAGNMSISTAQSKFGGSSGYWDGTGDYLTSPTSTDWEVGSGDFTIEFFFRYESAPPAQGMGLVSRQANYSSYAAFLGIINSTSNLQFLCSKAAAGWDINITDPSALSTGTWYHVAFVRYGNLYTIYKNGTSVASTTVSGALYNSGQALTIGAQGAAGQYGLNGYIEEFRFKKEAVYTANFTAPSSPFIE